jgi:hypothetical protein
MNITWAFSIVKDIVSCLMGRDAACGMDRGSNRESPPHCPVELRTTGVSLGAYLRINIMEIHIARSCFRSGLLEIKNTYLSEHRLRKRPVPTTLEPTTSFYLPPLTEQCFTAVQEP